jgi:hypothetical protein
MDRGTNLALHPDAYQFTFPVENAIAYGVVAQDAIGSFGIRMQPSASDVAIVDSQFTVTAPYVWELERPYTNILVKDSTLNGGFSEYSTFVATDLVFNNVTFSTPPAPQPGMFIQ